MIIIILFRISPEEYVGAIDDTLKLQKNIGLCRNFQQLDRAEVFRSVQEEIEVENKASKWPIGIKDCFHLAILNKHRALSVRS